MKEGNKNIIIIIIIYSDEPLFYSDVEITLWFYLASPNTLNWI